MGSAAGTVASVVKPSAVDAALMATWVYSAASYGSAHAIVTESEVIALVITVSVSMVLDWVVIVMVWVLSLFLLVSSYSVAKVSISICSVSAVRPLTVRVLVLTATVSVLRLPTEKAKEEEVLLVKLQYLDCIKEMDMYIL